MMISPTPTIPSSPRVTPYVDRTVRMMFDCNVFPVLQKTPQGWFQLTEAQAYMQQLGFDETMIVYNGSINTAGAWNTNGVPDVIEEITNRFDTTRYCNVDYLVSPSPPTEKVKVMHAATAIAKLSQSPGLYGNAAKPTMPVIIDIEGTATFNRHPGNIAEATTTAKTWSELYAKLRYTIGDYAPLFGFGYWSWNVNKYWGEPTDDHMKEFAKAERTVANQLSGACCEFYNRADCESNVLLWYHYVTRAESLIDRYYPGWKANRIAVISPAYQHDPGRALPMNRWEKQLAYLADRKWNMLVWTDTHTPFDIVKGHLNHAARYVK